MGSVELYRRHGLVVAVLGWGRSQSSGSPGSPTRLVEARSSVELYRPHGLVVAAVLGWSRTQSSASPGSPGAAVFHFFRS
jgi:hypothetical protein